MSITAVSPVDGRYQSKTTSLSTYFSEGALIKYRTIVEIEYFKALMDFLPEATLSDSAREFCDNLINNFSDADAQKVKDIEATTNHDVKAVEYFLKEKFETHPELKAEVEYIHFALTSEDINNLAYALMFKDARNNVVLPALSAIHEKLDEMANEYKSIAMLSRTHGQSATPTTLGKEINVFGYRLAHQIQQLEIQEVLGKLGGATGSLNAHVIAYPELDWKTFAQNFVESLDLTFNPMTTQIEPHDFIAELSHNMIRIDTILLDCCKDIWHYISLRFFTQTTKAGEVGSSTMPHKVNPIDFENAEGNFGIANALFNHFALKLPISRLQRDLTDSTVLRSVGSAFAYVMIALVSLEKGLNKISPNLDVIENDLNNHPEVLAEAIQTVLRRYKKETPYEKLKALTRGKVITLESLATFIDELDLPEDEKARLKALKPSDYIGLA